MNKHAPTIEKNLDSLAKQAELKYKQILTRIHNARLVRKTREAQGITIGQLAYVTAVSEGAVMSLEKARKIHKWDFLPHRVAEALGLELTVDPELGCVFHDKADQLSAGPAGDGLQSGDEG